MEGREEVGAGYMLVPWSSWDQWSAVRESLFSSSRESVASALRRITAWKSRGCLPVAIEVTARIVEIQHMDPFFRREVSSDTIDSEDMLAMLYSIALTRLVNGFVGKVSYFDDHSHKHGKKKHSISGLADAIGVPRMVVDIRHECSHRELPSLPLVRLASIKALDWLKTHYWQPQNKAIPDVRKEIKTKVHQMICYIKTKHQGRLNHSLVRKRRVGHTTVLRVGNKLSSQMSGKLLNTKISLKQVSNMSKVIARLYSTYPCEVVFVFLEIFQSQALYSFNNVTVECGDDSTSSNRESHASCIYELKDIILRLSRKIPGLLLAMLKEIFGMIEAMNDANYKTGECSLPFPEAETHQMELLSSLVPWLLVLLKGLRDSGQITLFDDSQGVSARNMFTPKISLKELLRRCLLLSSSGNRHLMDAAIFVSEMMGNSLLTARIEKLRSLGPYNIDAGVENEDPCPEALLLREEESLEQAIEKVGRLKSRRRLVSTEETGVNAEAAAKRKWKVAKRWTPCPIGTLPGPLSSTAFVPVLDRTPERCQTDVAITDHERTDEIISSDGKRGAGDSIGLPDCSPPPKKPRGTAENAGAGGEDDGSVAPSLEGLLLIDGIWRRVGEEELLAIESDIRILV